MAAERAGPRARRRIRLRPRFFVVVALLIFLTYTVYGYVTGYMRLRALRAELEQVQQEIQELRRLNAALEEELARYDSDEVIERIAREQLRLVAPGETPVIIIDPPAAASKGR